MTETQALYQIKKIFKDNLFERRVLSKKGRLETNRLSFHKTSSKLFSQKLSQQDKHYSLEILIDGSGSMGSSTNSRSFQAFTAAKNIISILQYVCNINVKIFSTATKSLSMKEFMMLTFQDYNKIRNRSLASERIGGDTHIVEFREGMLEENTDRYGVNNGATWDICAMHNAVNALKKREGGKIVMILQDGETWGQHIQGDYVDGLSTDKYNEYTFPALLKKYKQDGIHIVSFGIQTDEFRFRYLNAGHDFILIEDANEIYPKMVDYLKKIIK